MKTVTSGWWRHGVLITDISGFSGPHVALLIFVLKTVFRTPFRILKGVMETDFRTKIRRVARGPENPEISVIRTPVAALLT